MINYNRKSVFLLVKEISYHLKKNHIDVQCDFLRDMVEEERVSLVKVVTLKNVGDALKKSMSTEKFLWCRETMGTLALDRSLYTPMTPYLERKKRWENVFYVLYF